ncbi:MAG: hypothetical protein F2563_01305 [Actinobacteria bacterium]|uniref:Unannotated protein n=1 Tax=freshwater metagenome TaxID=449393 RepID=A0A6J6EBK7_9ZZZZ|nr:hypothetical protein [Actinomycetota bacterium]
MNPVKKFFSGDAASVALNVFLVLYIAFLAPMVSGLVYPLIANPIGKAVMAILIGVLAMTNTPVAVLVGVAFIIALLTPSSYSGFTDGSEAAAMVMNAAKELEKREPKEATTTDAPAQTAAQAFQGFM